MEFQSQKKVRVFDEDRISSLPDELIHKFLSYLDAKVALQTSVLSKRWKLVWTTLPYLNFGEYKESSAQNTLMFLHHVMSNRNHQSHISELNSCISDKSIYSSVEKFVKYAILHNVMCLNLDFQYYGYGFKLSSLSSTSLEKLTLCVKLEEFWSESDGWDLPALTCIHLRRPSLFRLVSLGGVNTLRRDSNVKPTESCLTCLPALRTLCLEFWDLSNSLFSFSLPHLTTLCMYGCRKLPQKVWNFPVLLSLELKDVDFPVNMSEIFPTLVNLQNLTLSLTRFFMEQHNSISCPQLLNLDISIYCSDSLSGDIKVFAPKLCNFTSYGILSITFEAPELENVKVKLHNWFGIMDWIYRKKYYPVFTNMLSGVGNAKNLIFDLDSMKALSAIPDLSSVPSPFFKLKHVKVPRGYNDSSICSALRNYLLGGSPRATIVATVPQILTSWDCVEELGNKLVDLWSNMIPQTVAASVTSQIQEPLAAPTKELDDSQHIHQTLSVNTVNMDVQEEHVLEDSVGDVDRVRHIDSSVEGSKDRMSSGMGNIDISLWRGHEVFSGFVCLLNCIMHKYPETFEHFTHKNKKLCTMYLNMLCTSLNDFTKISMTEVDSEMIVGYRDAFAYLQNQGFNISWAVCRLNYIEQIRFSEPLIPELHAIDIRIEDNKIKLQEGQASVTDVKIELQELQALREEKLTYIEKAFGTMGAKLAVGFIGDDLLSSP